MAEQCMSSSPAESHRNERLMRDLTKLPPHLPLHLHSFKQHFRTSNGYVPVIIALAIWASPEKKLTLAQIRESIEPYFPEVARKDFRAILSNKHMFVREHRGVEHGGRGGFWTVNPSQQGSRKAGQSPPGSPMMEEHGYKYALKAGINPAMLHA